MPGIEQAADTVLLALEALSGALNSPIEDLHRYEDGFHMQPCKGCELAGYARDAVPAARRLAGFVGVPA